MKHYSILLKEIRDGILSLIKKYRVSKDKNHLKNIQRLLSWRKDIIHYEYVFKMGKEIIRSTEQYESCPKWEKVFPNAS